MPPNSPAAPFSQEAQRLIELLAHYLDLFESYSDQVRCLPNGEELYNSANSKWMQDPFITPLAGDAAQRTAFFARCNAIIDSVPVTIEQRFKIIYTCWAATRVIIDQDLQKLHGRDQGRVLGEAGRIVSLEAHKRKQTTAAPLETPNPRLPAHLSAAFYPSLREEDPIEKLLGQTIRYRHHKDNAIRECRVMDYGTSRLKGEWYCIAHNDDDVDEITASEMKDILASRV
ncbi:hypothetical protein FIBSPDRAFT_1054450 [Athelia psychrophila]|uniref:Uncharacterized protein n=1 Tax=Athelia psychrophila TaxID=1759441 RepID=A0A167VA72_9AGAM|nr:hypothetical protein FIBSPDRAFT_1054450 [Fibularhizoctonia sp. CBS 109695]